jgi:hypothetical protein
VSLIRKLGTHANDRAPCASVPSQAAGSIDAAGSRTASGVCAPAGRASRCVAAAGRRPVSPAVHSRGPSAASSCGACSSPTTPSPVVLEEVPACWPIFDRSSRAGAVVTPARFPIRAGMSPERCGLTDRRPRRSPLPPASEALRCGDRCALSASVPSQVPRIINGAGSGTAPVAHAPATAPGAPRGAAAAAGRRPVTPDLLKGSESI